MNKPKFDPTKPFEPIDDVKPKFDPNIPFEQVEELPAQQRDIRPISERVSSNLDQAIDTLSGLGQGTTFKWGDELAASVDQLIPEGGSDVDEQLKAQGFQIEQPEDTYETSQKLFERFNKEAQERTPIGYTGGEILGNIASTVALGKVLPTPQTAAQKAGTTLGDIYSKNKLVQAVPEVVKEASKRAGILAAEGAGYGALMGAGEQSDDRLQGALEEGSFGALAGGALSGIQSAGSVGKQIASDSIDAIKVNPYVQDLTYHFTKGTEGINTGDFDVKSQLEKKALYEPVDELTSKIFETDENLGKGIEQVLNNSRQPINISNTVNKGFKSLNDAYIKNPSIAQARGGEKIFNRLSQTNGVITPDQANVLMKDIQQFIDILQGSQGTDAMMRSELISLKNSLRDELINQVPGYKQAIEKFEQFRTLVPENILAGERELNKYSPKLRDISPEKRYETVRGNLEDIFSRATKQENVGSKSNIALSNIADRMGNNIQGFKGSDILEQGKKASDEVRALRGRFNEQFTTDVAASAIIPKIAGLAKGKGLAVANVAGRVANPAAQLSKNLFQAPIQQLQSAASKLLANPKTSRFGEALKQAIDTNDMDKKKAALFIIMQNPDARLELYGNEQEE